MPSPLTAGGTLAEFAAALRYEDIAFDVLDCARACIIDTVAVAAYGARFAWSTGIAHDAPSLEGMPGEPMRLESLRAKFDFLTRDAGEPGSRSLFDRYSRLEERESLA
ncbi:MAG: hypothetical protein HY017_14895 [Betaproteobacteria bacterium]|nr:hypothetical protein [Betaproteobacteria bacterium]